MYWYNLSKKNKSNDTNTLWNEIKRLMQEPGFEPPKAKSNSAWYSALATSATETSYLWYVTLTLNDYPRSNSDFKFKG